MRRKKLRLLANCTRLLLLAICCAAGGTAAIWNWRPEWVAAADGWLQQQFVLDYRDRIDAIVKEVDPSRRATQCAALVEELAWVRRQDNLANVVSQCYSQLSQIAEATGDLAAARQWLERWLAFDDCDILLATRLGDLECRTPEQRDAGLARLTALNKQYPGHPIVVRALTSDLVLAGRPADAGQVLDAAMHALRSNLWTIAWNVGQGIDLTTRRVETIPVRESDEASFRFRIDEPIVGIAILPPAFHSALLERPRLDCGPGKVIDLTDAQTVAVQVRVGRQVAVTTGDGGPSLTAQWNTPIPANTPLVLHWRETPMLELAYAACLTLPALGSWIDAVPSPADPQLLQRLRAYRARAASSGDWQLFWCRNGEQFGAARSRVERLIPIPNDRGCTFTGQFQLDDQVDVMRFDFPEGVGVSYAFSRFELQAGERSLPIDLTTVEMLAPNNVERRGDQLVVTGPDAYFSFAMPPTLKVATVTIAGVAR